MRLRRRRGAVVAVVLVTLLTLAGAPALAQGTVPPSPGDVGPASRR